MSLDMWQGAEQEFAAGPQPVCLFEALGGRGVFIFRPVENIPRAHIRNGGVCYIHSNLFEVSTPECRDALQLVAYDKASEAYARLASWALEEETGQQVHLYKTNIASDPKMESEYTTVGAHENYLVEREKYEGKESLLVPYLVLRQVFVGAGGYVGGSYWVSPRTIFPKKIYSEVSTDYPIVSTRDEPHAEEKFFRVHVVNGEGVRSEYTTFLKHSITSYVLQAIQEGYVGKTPKLADPLTTGQEISRNLMGDWEVELVDGRSIRVLDYLNSYYLEGVERVFEDREANDHDRLALREFKRVSQKLDEGLIEDLDTSIEWVIKLSLIERGFDDNFQLDEGLDEASAKEAAAFQYTAVTDSLFEELVGRRGIRTMVSDEEVERAFRDPPREGRGGLRVAIADRFSEALASLSWSYAKLRKGRAIIQFPFLDMNGWSQGRISKTLEDINSLLKEDGPSN
jgi:hypothetical protein